MKPINIAIIDSGINPRHFHVGNVAGGIAFEMDESDGVKSTFDFADRIGHGTAIAGVIREKNPGAALYALKIFHKQLTAPFALLKAALEFAIRQQMDIIHLSLGTDKKSCGEELEILCREANELGIVIVSSARSKDDVVYPSVFNTVVGVYADQNCGPDEVIHHPEGPINYGAHGYPRPLPGLDQDQNFFGGSFAAARVTGRIARELSTQEFFKSHIQGIKKNIHLCRWYISQI